MSAAAARPMRNEGEFISPVADPPLLFRRLHAREALGRLPEYSLELLRPSRASNLEPRALLGQKATVRIEIEDGVQRHVNGVVTRFEQGGMLGRFDIYHVELRPWLFHLTLSADCRIFQDKTAIEILDQVFHDYDPAPVDKRMAGSFRKRPYTVQYRESDFNFVSRLMEEEGLYYYFRHEKDRHTLVLCNGPGGHAPLATGTLHWAARQTGEVLREDIVTAWSRTTTLQPEKFSHLDHAADAPSADLRGEASRSSPYPRPREREVFDYPGGFEDLAMDRSIAAKQQEATRLARLRVDAFESGHVTASGITPHRPMPLPPSPRSPKPGRQRERPAPRCRPSTPRPRTPRPAPPGPTMRDATAPPPRPTTPARARPCCGRSRTGSRPSGTPSPACPTGRRKERG